MRGVSAELAIKSSRGVIVSALSLKGGIDVGWARFCKMRNAVSISFSFHVAKSKVKSTRNFGNYLL